MRIGAVPVGILGREELWYEDDCERRGIECRAAPRKAGAFVKSVCDILAEGRWGIGGETAGLS